MVTLLLIVLSAILGIKEGILYSRKGADAFPGNEHVLFTWERLVCAGLVVAAILDTYWLGMVGTGGEVVSWSFYFSFFHNEAYYGCRARIEGIPYVFGYKSPTTTAKVDFSGPQRQALAIIGAVLVLSMVVFRKQDDTRLIILGAYVVVSALVWGVTKYKTSKRRKVTLESGQV